MTFPLPAPQPDFHAQQDEPINLNEEASVNYWVAALDCSEMALRVAVAEVGAVAKDVGNELGKAL